LRCEVNTLAYPKAALFGFCVAVLAYNVLSVVKAALRATHGAERIDAVRSTYYLTEEIAGTYRGMMIAIPEKHWQMFATMTAGQFANTLKELARKVDLAKLTKHPRGPKKPQPRRRVSKRVTHVATSRLLAGRRRGTK